jgi:hypothetical protein
MKRRKQRGWYYYQPLAVPDPKGTAFRLRLAGWKADLTAPLRRRQLEREHGLSR